MSTTQITLLALGAMLLFWTVGAYNRLVLLRNGIAHAFAALEAQIARRNGLLEQWVAQLVPGENATPDRLVALLAAIGQTRSACDHARHRPCVASAVASLALAEAVLAEARARVDGALQSRTEAVAEAATPTLNAELGAADLALAFARERFNGAVKQYNHAVQQFPTHLICPMFGFRATGSL